MPEKIHPENLSYEPATGSNGKSTTTALIHHILKAANRPTQMGGNIGRGVLDLEIPTEGEIIGLKHRETPTIGVQFHPESILTECGIKILGNFLKL